MGHYNRTQVPAAATMILLILILPLALSQILGAGSSFFDTSLFDFGGGSGLGVGGSGARDVNVLSGVGGEGDDDKRSLLIMGGTKNPVVVNPWMQNLRQQLKEKGRIV